MSMSSKVLEDLFSSDSQAITEPFAPYQSIGEEETHAAIEVLKSGCLSGFLGSAGSGFLGGKNVQEFEKACCEYFHVSHAIVVNSWTSGLIASLGAIGLEPGDEVIVTPWTMCATATAILHWNAIPIFADIEDSTFCLDPEDVKRKISVRTKAIMSVDIFGQSADIDSLKKIADENELYLLSDCAQAPGSTYKGTKSGTLCDIGGYSLNYHKHIHTGEGGIVVTNDSKLAERVRLIRNHGEAVIAADSSSGSLSNIIGHNFRLGEIESAIGIEQLKKLDVLIQQRVSQADKLRQALAGLPGLRLPVTRKDCTNVYYMFPMVLDTELLGVDRKTIYNSLLQEGMEGLTLGYQNIHQLPIFQRKIAYGSQGFPWLPPIYSGDVDYSKGTCPVAERLHDSTYLGFEICSYNLSDTNINQIAMAFRKVWSQMGLI